MQNNKAFSIIELLVVIAIFAILAVFGYPKVDQWLTDREVKKAFFDKQTCTLGDQLRSDGQLNASEVFLDILILSSRIKPLNEPGHSRSLVPSL